MLTSKTGGAYIPPAKLRMMQKTMSDKTGVEFQRLSWEALKKSINGLINKVTYQFLQGVSIFIKIVTVFIIKLNYPCIKCRSTRPT